MDRLTAFTKIHTHIIGGDDDDLLTAWHVLTTLDTPSPPIGVGRVQIEAAKLAQQIHNTGLAGDWKPPPNNSQAMERLIHQLTNLLESFIDIYLNMETQHD